MWVVGVLDDNLVADEVTDPLLFQPVASLRHDGSERIAFADVGRKLRPATGTEHLHISHRVKKRMDGTLWGPIRDNHLCLHGSTVLQLEHQCVRDGMKFNIQIVVDWIVERSVVPLIGPDLGAVEGDEVIHRLKMLVTIYGHAHQQRIRGDTHPSPALHQRGQRAERRTLPPRRLQE